MANKLWNGADALYLTPADWSPFGLPAAGDTARIGAGQVTLSSAKITGVALTVASSSSASPTFVLSNGTLDPATTLTIAASTTSATLSITNYNYNAGTINVVSPSATAVALVLFPNDVGPAILGSAGNIAVDGGAAFQISNKANAAGLTNAGNIFINNSYGGTRGSLFTIPVDGTGTFFINNGTYTVFADSIGSGQIFRFGAGTETVQINAPTVNNAYFVGLTATARVALLGLNSTTVNYKTTSANSGDLVFSQGNTVVSTLHFYGDLALNSFNVSSVAPNGVPFTIVAGSGAAPVRVTYTDTVTGVSGTDPATYYTGPVNYLQFQYIWNSTDSVNMVGQSDNMFLKGGGKSDAIVAHGGSNVIDGGGGSDFITGGTGADGGTDTIFIDGRGGVETWSSIVNFHKGDAVTIFGFRAGVSTLPFTPVDGAPGYQGATIHSELNGSGTGVNGSVTFVGISLADAQSKFTYSNGNVGGADYLFIQFTG